MYINPFLQFVRGTIQDQQTIMHNLFPTQVRVLGILQNNPQPKKRKPLSKQIKDLEVRYDALRKENQKGLVEKFKDCEREIGEFLKCSICNERYSRKVQKSVLSCGHSFCQECLDKWFERKLRCPKCRRRVLKYKEDVDHVKKKDELLSIIDSISEKGGKKKRKISEVSGENELEPSPKRKIKIDVFWTEISDTDVKCNYCWRVKKKSRILNHWWTCSRNKHKPILELEYKKKI